MPAQEVTDEEVRSLTQSILTRYGIDFTCYEPKSLRRRIMSVLHSHNYQSIHELWVRFLHDATFVYTFMNGISVGMTSMFRDPILWKTLKHKLRFDYRDRDSLSVWHAGCSTGEEVYSLGILLRETHLTHKVKACATDINQEAIQTAQHGVYHKLRMIENETNYREYNSTGDLSRYYKAAEKEVTMNPDLISHVSFRYHNLITDAAADRYDIILCRNVMIYFDNQAKARLLTKFYDALTPGGLFIVGFYDAPIHLVDDTQFDLIDADAKIFRKKL